MVMSLAASFLTPVSRRWLACSGLAGMASIAALWFGLGDDSARAQSGRSPIATVAVIDVIEIARQLGERERLQGQLDEHQSELTQKLELLQQDYLRRLEERKRELGTPISENQQRELEQFTASLNTQILQERNFAQNEYARFQAELEGGFAVRVKPIALAVARELGHSVVLTKPIVFAYGEEADVTAAVIERMRKMPEFATPGPNVTTPRPRVGATQRSGGQFRGSSDR